MIEIKPIPATFGFQDLTGQPFGRWTVLGYAGSEKKHRFWWCRCTCGKVKKVFASILKGGRSTSCGCFRREVVGDRFRTHALTGTKEHRIWRNMLNRCTNPNVPAWPNYGGRGITVCKRWENFEHFLSDMGHCPSGLTLDRRDNSKGYSPGNCRWADRKTQNQNRRGCGLTDEERRLRTNARQAVQRAVRRGTLVKPSRCEYPTCAASDIQAHHEDYSRPLVVRWLCRRHHAAADMLTRNHSPMDHLPIRQGRAIELD